MNFELRHDLSGLVFPLPGFAHVGISEIAHFVVVFLVAVVGIGCFFIVSPVVVPVGVEQEVRGGDFKSAFVGTELHVVGRNVAGQKLADAVPDVRTARDNTVGSALAVETLHVVGHVVQNGQVVLHHDDVFIGGDHVAVYLAPLLLAAVHEVPETASRHMVQAAAKRCSSLQNHGANDSIR